MPSHYIPRPPRILLHLPVKTWPQGDQVLFERAFAAVVDPFAEDGQGRRYRPSTQTSITNAWRRWLGWLRREDPAALLDDPAARLTPDRVQRFVAALATTNEPRAIAMTLQFLYCGARITAPKTDWGWLRTLQRRFDTLAGTRKTKPMPINGRQLLDLGLALMDEAHQKMELARNAKSTTGLPRLAIDYRDGLLIALLAVFPLRRTNVASLIIGESVVRVGDLWQIQIAGGSVKNHEDLDATLSVQISACIDHFLADIRPLFYQSACHRGLWASTKGQPATGTALYEAFTKRIFKMTGHHVRLHDVRAIAVTTWALEDPVGSVAARDLLGNRSPRIIEHHYNKAQAIQASRMMAGLKKKMRQSRDGSERSN